MATRDFTGLGRYLRFEITSSPGEFRLVHYDRDVNISDYILLGLNWQDARRFEVIENRSYWRLADQWCATIRRSPKPLYALGHRYEHHPAEWINDFQTLEGIEAVFRGLCEGRPIVSYAIDRDGTVTERTLWHPDYPPIDFSKLRAFTESGDAR